MRLFCSISDPDDQGEGIWDTGHLLSHRPDKSKRPLNIRGRLGSKLVLVTTTIVLWLKQWEDAPALRTIRITSGKPTKQAAGAAGKFLLGQ